MGGGSVKRFYLLLQADTAEYTSLGAELISVLHDRKTRNCISYIDFILVPVFHFLISLKIVLNSQGCVLGAIHNASLLQFYFVFQMPKSLYRLFKFLITNEREYLWVGRKQF